MKITAIVFFTFITIKVFSQTGTCDYFPADCPDEGSIDGSQSRSARLGNGITEKEVNMQDRMRDLIKPMMQHAADALGWQLVEIDEVTNKGALQSAFTPDPLRSPRGFGIEFEFIVNSDSLKLWKDWLLDFANRYQNASMNDINKQSDVANSPLYKQYGDSVNDYIKLYTDYITAHQSEGAALFSDPKLIRLQNKQKEFIDKQNALLNRGESEKNSNTFESEKAQRTKQFRMASTMEIFFQVNTEVGIIHSSDGTEQVTNYYLPGSAFAKSVHMPQFDPNTMSWLFDQWENMTVILLGKWQQTLDQYKNYNAMYKLNGQSDEHTPKKISSDKVQVIAIHVMGNKTNTDKLIRQLDIAKLNSAIDK